MSHCNEMQRGFCSVVLLHAKCNAAVMFMNEKVLSMKAEREKERRVAHDSSGHIT